MQGTKPGTLAYGLLDSPVGLAAWIAEKMIGWSDRSGAAENTFTPDDVLANVTLYWLTGSIGSSFWPYWARAHGDWSVQDVLARGGRLGPAAGYALSPADNIRAPREVAERFLDLRRFVELPGGGHFPAFEMPRALAGELQLFSGSCADQAGLALDVRRRPAAAEHAVREGQAAVVAGSADSDSGAAGGV